MGKIIKLSDRRGETTVGEAIFSLSDDQFNALGDFCEALITMSDEQIKAVRYLIDKCIEEKDQL